MHIKRLRLVGFKSFVEPTELVIEPGLTGVVGPNGCGKSNLLEAIRWVMGESSHKSMRAAAMDDVIFAGSVARPARNFAEVTIALDNTERTAPAEFNDATEIEITRRIEREQGSSYRVNGGETRARDVKLLFEDAATGARSPALVRQGQIAEIVNARPEARRRILEDAAGVAGLHSRRHEAELRLKAAEANLARVADVIGQLDSQIANLKRQSRQAKRYKELSGLIRQWEALNHVAAWEGAKADAESIETAHREALAAVAEAAEAESAALIAEAGAAERLPALREKEAVRAAVLHRLEVELQSLVEEEKRAIEREAELERRLIEARRDEVRETELAGEAAEAVGLLERERLSLAKEPEAAARILTDARTRRGAAVQESEAADTEFARLTGKLSDLRANYRRLEDAFVSAERETEAERQQLAGIERTIAAMAGEEGEAFDAIAARLLTDIEAKSAGLTEADAKLRQTEAGLAAARTLETEARRTVSEECLKAERLTSEQSTLAKLFERAAAQKSLRRAAPAVAEALKIGRGFERAVAAALGEDIEASNDPAESRYWRNLGDAGDPQLPDGVEPLSAHVEAPVELARRFRQIGVITEKEASLFQARLRPGQRLVSKQGALWRWDGFVAKAGAPTAYALRLEQMNRQAALAEEITAARGVVETAEAGAKAAAGRVAVLIDAERQLKSEFRSLQLDIETARGALAGHEVANRQRVEQRASLAEARRHRMESIGRGQLRADAAKIELAGLPPMAELESELEQHSEVLRHLRSERSAAEVTLQSLEREAELRASRLEAITADIKRWQQRRDGAAAQTKALTARIEDLGRQSFEASEAPARIKAKRGKLDSTIGQSASERRAAADAVQHAENEVRDIGRLLKGAQAAHGMARETKAGLEARLEGARERRTEISQAIHEAFGVQPDECLKAVGLSADARIPPDAEIERQLLRLKEDRERLGGVNLRAEEELHTLEQQQYSLSSEKADLDSAIERLRQAIGKLDREGKKRLSEAFEIVNGHFQKLFVTLFGGGEARLEMVATEDPLEMGLEIIAKPPGKKPATLSLLSGGEQTLTALSLIFAVFLTNPSPICVLDEVDAPLDDANVDRFCTLMEEMARTTTTRFLVITHHPMTMSRMHRLFGVTMVEKGISQLVSVDLGSAERFLEAG